MASPFKLIKKKEKKKEKWQSLLYSLGMIGKVTHWGGIDSS